MVLLKAHKTAKFVFEMKKFSFEFLFITRVYKSILQKTDFPQITGKLVFVLKQ